MTDELKVISKEQFDVIRKKVYEEKGKFLVHSTGNIIPDLPYVYIEDYADMKWYKVPAKNFQELLSALKRLKTMKLFIREGFVDKSLNTSMYSPIDRFTYNWAGIEFRYEDLEKWAKEIKDLM